MKPPPQARRTATVITLVLASIIGGWYTMLWLLAGT